MAICCTAMEKEHSVCDLLQNNSAKNMGDRQSKHGKILLMLESEGWVDDVHYTILPSLMKV